MADRQYRVLLYNMVHMRTLGARIVHHTKRTALGRKLGTLWTRRRCTRLTSVLNHSCRRSWRSISMYKRCHSSQNSRIGMRRFGGCPVRWATVRLRDLDAPGTSTCRAWEQRTRTHAGLAVFGTSTRLLLRQSKAICNTLTWCCKAARWRWQRVGHRR